MCFALLSSTTIPRDGTYRYPAQCLACAINWLIIETLIFSMVALVAWIAAPIVVAFIAAFFL